MRQARYARMSEAERETEFTEQERRDIEAEGKEHPCLIGVLKMGTKEMKEKKKGVGIENGHYVGDGLWKLDLS